MRNPYDGWIEGERFGLRFGCLLKGFAAHEASRNAAAVQVLDVMQTARRTGTSISQAFDHDVAALDYILQDLFRRRLGMRGFFEAQYLVTFVCQ